MEYTYTYNNLKRILQTESGMAFAKKTEKVYLETYANKPLTVLTYSKYKLIHTTGERALCEEEFFDRRSRLRLLQILAIYDDKYISDLEDLLNAICEEYTWVLPAHNKRDFGRFDYTEIDLFSAETAAYLSETAYVLKDKLCTDIKGRIHACLYERIVKNFESREFVFDHTNNNWSAVCSGGVGITYLYAFPESFERVKDRIFKLMGDYLKSIDEDGYCIEGTNYWQYGFGFFALFFDVYVGLTGDYPDILKTDKVQNTVNFLANAHLGGKKFLPYGDGGIREFVGAIDMYSPIKNLFKDKFQLPVCAGESLDDMLNGEGLLAFRKGLGFKGINAVEVFGGEQCVLNYGLKYYKKSEVVIYRNKNYSFTTQSGRNDVSHSHNDIGAFEIIKDDKRLIADLGAGEYTWGYFNDFSQRYGDDIFVCGSQSHSVPMIDGKRQKELHYYGKVLSISENDFKIDIANAYENAIDSLIVNYAWDDDGVKITYEFDEKDQKQLTYRFISDYAPVVKGDKVVIEDTLEISCSDKTVAPTISVKKYKIRRGEVQDAFIIDYVFPTKNKDKVQFDFIVK